jgi:hypothetical protein
VRRLARYGVVLAALALACGPAAAVLAAPVTRPGVDLALKAPAAHSPKTVTARVTRAAWFQPDPLCATPLGCGAIPLPALSPYPKGTFHVGTALGRQTARAYIAVTLSKAAQRARGGTLSIPLDTNPADGSIAPSAAAINVCVIYQALPLAEGAFAGAPAPNCLPAARAKYVAAPAPHLVADLSRLGGKLVGVKGFALLPAEAKPVSAWHVVFKLPAGAAPVSALPKLTLLVGRPVAPHSVSNPAPAVHTGSHPGRAESVVPVGPAPELPPSVATIRPSNPPPVVAQRPTGHYVTIAYQYPEVWLLPLVLIVLVPFTIRAMTKDLSRR